MILLQLFNYLNASSLFFLRRLKKADKCKTALLQTTNSIIVLGFALMLLSLWYFMASISSLSVGLLTGAHVLLFIGVYLFNGFERSATLIKRSLHAQASI